MTLQELFSDSSKWTQQTYARDITGRPVTINDIDAVCFCLMGAIYKCYPSTEEKAKVIQKLESKRLLNITFWNDARERKFEEVQQLVKELNI